MDGQEIKDSAGKGKRRKSTYQQIILLVVLFLILQLYVSLCAVLFQRLENPHYKSGSNGINNVDDNKNIEVLMKTVGFLSKYRKQNSTGFKRILKVLNLQLNYIVLLEEKKKKAESISNNFSYVFSFMMSSVLLIGNADFKPSSTGSIALYAISIVVGLYLSFSIVWNTSASIKQLLKWILSLLKRWKGTAKLNGCTILILVLILMLLCGAPFYSTNFITGLVMAMDAATKTGNYELSRMHSLPKHPIAATIFSCYNLFCLSLMFIIIQIAITTKWACVLHIRVDCPINCKRLITKLKSLFHREDGDILEEDVEQAPLRPKRLHVHSFDPPVISPIRTRLTSYNKGIAKQKSPLLVIKEMSPDLHGEYINKFEEEKVVGEGNNCKSPISELKSLSSDSWAEFLREDDDKSSVSEYSIEGSFSSESTDIDINYLQRRESGISDTNVVTDYPWLDSNVNILELTEQNVQMLFGNESPQSSTDSKDDSKRNKKSLTRTNALDFTQRKTQVKRKPSNTSDISEEKTLDRKISKSDERVNYSGIVGQGLLQRASDITGNLKLLAMNELDGEEFTRSDFFTGGRRLAVMPKSNIGLDGRIANSPITSLPFPKLSIKVDKPPESDVSDLDSEMGCNDFSDSSCSENIDDQSLTRGVQSPDSLKEKDYLDVHVLFPMHSLSQRRHQLSHINENTPDDKEEKDSTASIQIGDKNFARCFSGPVRSLSDMSANSLRLIDMGDILYSDDETESPDKKKQRLETPTSDTQSDEKDVEEDSSEKEVEEDGAETEVELDSAETELGPHYKTKTDKLEREDCNFELKVEIQSVSFVDQSGESLPLTEQEDKESLHNVDDVFYDCVTICSLEDQNTHEQQNNIELNKTSQIEFSNQELNSGDRDINSDGEYSCSLETTPRVTKETAGQLDNNGNEVNLTFIQDSENEAFLHNLTKLHHLASSGSGTESESTLEHESSHSSANTPTVSTIDIPRQCDVSQPELEAGSPEVPETEISSPCTSQQIVNQSRYITQPIEFLPDRTESSGSSSPSIPSSFSNISISEIETAEIEAAEYEIRDDDLLLGTNYALENLTASLEESEEEESPTMWSDTRKLL